MIQNDTEMTVTLERIHRFQEQVAHLRHVESDPKNFRLSASGFVAEIDRMNLEVREYLLRHPMDAQTA